MQHEAPGVLPVPDRDSAEHSRRCASWIRERIRDSGGSISFAEYMHYALYAPGLGYYSAGSTKFGESGDYVTAPEVSPLFGRVLARQCAEVLAVIPGGAVLEYGAGSGRLAVDVLRALGAAGPVPPAYHILEVSAELAERQRRMLSSELPEQAASVIWHGRPPATHRGVIVVNEVLDALPVERFVRRKAGIDQVRVSTRDGQFVLVAERAPAVLERAVNEIEAAIGGRLPDGYASEVCLAVPGFIADLATTLAQGIAFVFDYGVSRRDYYGRERSGGWLRCHFRHRAHDDPLLFPGIQDITAWVDFTAVADAAVDNGLHVAGFVNQSQFLLHGGLEHELDGFLQLPPESQLELSAEVKMLTLPGAMGEHFKCMALARDLPALPSALKGADKTHTL